MHAMWDRIRKGLAPRLLSGALAALAVGALSLLGAGCGSVGDIGTGASRAGVQPVRGAYGAGGLTRSQDEVDRRVEQVAKGNRKPKKDASAVKALKEMPEGASDAVADAAAGARAELTDDIKIAVFKRQGRAPSAAHDRFAGGSARGSAGGRWVDPEDPYADY
jgi:hypothetical protein